MDLSLLCEEVVRLSLQVGEFILEEKSKVSTEDIELKSLNSLVSYVDKNAEKLLVEGLREILPQAGFIAEEGTSDKKGEQYNWIIDPLDGTTNFLHGIPVFAISIALMDGDEAVLGVVYELGQEEMFYAWKDGGAFLDGTPIKVSSNSDMKDSLFATGFPYYDFGRMQDFLELLQAFFEHSRGMRRLGSAATDMAYVACGRFNGFFEYGLSPWDVAGGVVLVKEAGGKVSDFKGGDDYIFGKEIAVAGSNIFDPFLKLIQDHMAN